MKRLQIIVFFIILLAVVGCCPTRHLTSSTQDSVRVETVVRTEYIPDTVFVEVPIESERQTVRDSLVYRDKIVEKAVPVERELTWWQQTQMRGFWIVLAIIVVVYRKKIFAVVRRFI